MPISPQTPKDKNMAEEKAVSDICPPFALDERLALCASLVREGTALADIGTDHAKLPVWLAKMSRIKTALACDIRTGPLKNAEENIEKYGAGGTVKACLSDGLKNVPPDMAWDIVIAGMGGELITSIIRSTQWLRDGRRRLILQPMTHAELLRVFLCENGFEIVTERACACGRRPYTVMLCRYDGTKRGCVGVFKYIGGLCGDNSEPSLMYQRKISKQLRKKLSGLDERSGESEEARAVIRQLEEGLSNDDSIADL